MKRNIKKRQESFKQFEALDLQTIRAIGGDGDTGGGDGSGGNQDPPPGG